VCWADGDGDGNDDAACFADLRNGPNKKYGYGSEKRNEEGLRKGKAFCTR
jgi:hypothetical protein